MQKEQRDYLKERMGSVHTYLHSEYGESKNKPPEVLAAERVIEKWSQANAKKAKRLNEGIRIRYNKVREAIMGEDYAIALREVQAFEAYHEARE